MYALEEQTALHHRFHHEQVIKSANGIILPPASHYCAGVVSSKEQKTTNGYLSKSLILLILHIMWASFQLIPNLNQDFLNKISQVLHGTNWAQSKLTIYPHSEIRTHMLQGEILPLGYSQSWILEDLQGSSGGKKQLFQ